MLPCKWMRSTCMMISCLDEHSEWLTSWFWKMGGKWGITSCIYKPHHMSQLILKKEKHSLHHCTSQYATDFACFNDLHCMEVPRRCCWTVLFTYPPSLAEKKPLPTTHLWPTAHDFPRRWIPSAWLSADLPLYSLKTGFFSERMWTLQKFHVFFWVSFFRETCETAGSRCWFSFWGLEDLICATPALWHRQVLVENYQTDLSTASTVLTGRKALALINIPIQQLLDTLDILAVLPIAQNGSMARRWAILSSVFGEIGKTWEKETWPSEKKTDILNVSLF